MSALESGVSQVEEIKGRFPQVAGLRFAWDETVEPLKGRIKQVQVMKDGEWADIDPEATYKLVSNDFMRGGGDGYAVFKDNGMNAYDYGPGPEQVVADYIAANSPYSSIPMAASLKGGMFEMAKAETMATTELRDAEGAWPVITSSNRGDSWTIAREKYGDALEWKRIEEANSVTNVRAANRRHAGHSAIGRHRREAAVKSLRQSR
ncbi:MAG: 5'-nucleotidase C-terminal domain-containing protein [Phyllobacteriaceae bacterium]|nr:5'-nucleotidase C-terminal domain-containing protein [Phyllobacteriaceae bacterium]